jgi:hypothetical protein
MENSTVMKLNPKNKNPRHTKVPKSTNQSQPDFHDQSLNFDQINKYTVPTRSLKPRKRSLCKKADFRRVPKNRVFYGGF